MTERVWLLGLLCAASAGMAVVGCSSSDAPKGDTSTGGTAQGGSGNPSGGRTAQGGRSSGTSGSTSAAGTNANGGTTASGGSATNGGATANGGTTTSGGSAPSGGAGGCTPDLKCMPVAPNTGDTYADCVTRVNQFRACDCKPPLAQDKDGQMCADQQAAYDAMKNSAHAGFGASICKPDFHAQNECPGWGSQQDTIDGCAQQMYDEGPGPTDPCDGACYQAHGHFINMTGNYKMVTCGFATDSKGKVWTVQNYR